MRICDGVIDRCAANPDHILFRSGFKLGSEAATMLTSTSICDQTGIHAHLQLISTSNQEFPFGADAMMISHRRMMLATRGIAPTEKIATRAAR